LQRTNLLFLPIGVNWETDGEDILGLFARIV